MNLFLPAVCVACLLFKIIGWLLMFLSALGIVCLWPFSGPAPLCPCLALKNGSFALESSNVPWKTDISLLFQGI